MLVENFAQQKTSEWIVRDRITHCIDLIHGYIMQPLNEVEPSKGIEYPEFKILWRRIEELFPKQQFLAQDWKISLPNSRDVNQPLYAESSLLLDLQTAQIQLSKLKKNFPEAELVAFKDKYHLKIPDLPSVIGLWLRDASDKNQLNNNDYEALVVLAKHPYVHAINEAGIKTGKTALHRAAERGDLFKVTCLLQNGATALPDINKKMPADLVPATANFPQDIMKQLQIAVPPVNQNYSLSSN